MRRLAKIFDHSDNEDGELLVEETNTKPIQLEVVSAPKRRKSARSFVDSLPKVPSLASVSPEYAALLEQQAGLTAELSKAEQDINETIVRLTQVASEDALLKRGRIDAILDRVTGNGTNQTKQQNSLGMRLADLQEHAADLKAALAEVEQRIVAARNKASVQVCAQVEDQYRQIVVTICDRLRDLHEASLAYQRFTDALTGEDIAWTRLGVVFPTLLGDPRDSQSRVGHYFREAARLGFITTNDIPETLR
jgi:hypothetical protein